MSEETVSNYIEGCRCDRCEETRLAKELEHPSMTESNLEVVDFYSTPKLVDMMRQFSIMEYAFNVYYSSPFGAKIAEYERKMNKFKNR